MAVMIDVKGLRKDYGRLTALGGVTFQISAGEIVGFLGPNGAGKTTTMKILTGFISPSGGSATVAGFDVVSQSLDVRRRIGYLPENAPIYGEMRVIDYLDFVGRVRAMPEAERVRAIERVAAECDIQDRLYQTVGTLSKGYRQRVGLAQALLHAPPILILDEPTSGLDPNQILAIRNLIRRIGTSRTVILSTHILQEVQATCDRVLILNQGRVVADAPTEQIGTQEAGGTMARVAYAPGTVRLEAKVLKAAIEGIAGVQRVEAQATPEEGVHSFEVLATRDIRGDLFQLAVDRGLKMLELHRESSSLEEVFRRLTLGSTAGQVQQPGQHTGGDQGQQQPKSDQG
jgi:ABC-2 type transport system ATP-binding protein